MLMSHRMSSCIKDIVLNGPCEADILDSLLRRMLGRGWGMSIRESQEPWNLEFSGV